MIVIPVILQINSSTRLNKEDNDYEDNEYKIKMVKIIGTNLKTLNLESHLNYCRKEDCSKPFPSLRSCLLEL